jgi:hypothetical protein
MKISLKSPKEELIKITKKKKKRKLKTLYKNQRKKIRYIDLARVAQRISTFKRSSSA